MTEERPIRGRLRRILTLFAVVTAPIALAAMVTAAWAQNVVDTALDRAVVVAHADRTWELEARELQARPDLAPMLAAVRFAATPRGWSHLDDLVGTARGGGPADLLPLRAPPGALETRIAAMAAAVDVPADDATIELPDDVTTGPWEVVASRPGRSVDQRAAAKRVRVALRAHDNPVVLPVGEVAPSIPTEAAFRARPVLRDALDRALQRPLEVTHGDQSWTVTPAELAVEPVLDEALETALTAAAAGAAGEVTVAVEADRDAVRTLVDGIAPEVDRAPRDAAVDPEDLTVVPARTGLQVDRDAATDTLLSAVAERAERAPLPVDEQLPNVPTAAAQVVLPTVRQVLERQVEVVHGDTRWAVSLHDLGADLDLDGAFGHVLDGRVPDPADIGVHLETEAVAGFVAEVAGDVDRPPRHADMDWSSGWIERTPARDGQAVDRAAATDRLTQALLDGDADAVELPVDTVAARTEGVPHRVLLLRQNERRLYLYEGGEITRSWPVAVGLASHATPTGEFTVGAKRHRPTWTNPSPHGWGADMPARVGPGEDNPLGVRALNWNRHGRDTLIRFHGTPHEASIGEAASRGCVRMTNDDVRELYDLIPTGTKIVSVHG